jgi:hypothetical protein
MGLEVVVVDLLEAGRNALVVAYIKLVEAFTSFSGFLDARALLILDLYVAHAHLAHAQEGGLTPTSLLTPRIFNITMAKVKAGKLAHRMNKHEREQIALLCEQRLREQSEVSKAPSRWGANDTTSRIAVVDQLASIAQMLRDAAQRLREAASSSAILQHEEENHDIELASPRPEPAAVQQAEDEEVGVSNVHPRHWLLMMYHSSGGVRFRREHIAKSLDFVFVFVTCVVRRAFEICLRDFL